MTEASPSPEAKLERIRSAFTRLSVHFRETKDSRWYGVNCAFRVFDAIDQQDLSIEEAIDMLDLEKR